jgi:hypothetical protein
METLKSLKGTLTCFTLLLATNAFAANKGSLHVSAPENVAGERLAAGDYTVQWEAAGSSVELKIMQGSKVAATVPAKIIPLNDVSTENSVVVLTYDDGSRSLSEIFLSGKRFALEIGGETANLKSDISK